MLASDAITEKVRCMVIIVVGGRRRILKPLLLSHAHHGCLGLVLYKSLIIPVKFAFRHAIGLTLFLFAIPVLFLISRFSCALSLARLALAVPIVALNISNHLLFCIIVMR